MYAAVFRRSSGYLHIRDDYRVTGPFPNDSAAERWIESQLPQLMRDAGLDPEGLTEDEMRWQVEDDGLTMFVVTLHEPGSE